MIILYALAALGLAVLIIIGVPLLIWKLDARASRKMKD